ncbi:TonB-dependent receptor plug domain-containing protein [Pseudoxanthomonas suwonensis]|uniref:TonB-dependent receptor plug domain-containing protein n=1 Tax=Pseudoxanthomonas suwonensis TaxID=314722 RepID=UPI0004664B46|nr:TonB-dependent receptor [Pseudoxanthomonas suwonensis]
MRPRDTTTFFLRGCLLLAGGCASASMAQDATPAGDARSGVYLPDYFAATAPANAWDMVQRLPGFTLVEADADVRGYAGASGNVLFDGARPTSKRESLEGLLKRIPAASVERIELLQAGTPGVDMGSHAVLANVVRHRQASTELALEAGLAASPDGWLAPQGELEYGRRWDGQALDLSLKREPELDDDSGHGRIVEHDLASGQSRSSDWDTRTIKRKDEAGASWRRPLGPGQLSLVAAARAETSDSDGRIAGEDTEYNREREDYLETELGARYVVQFGGRTTLEAMASRQRADIDSAEVAREGDDEERFDEHGRSGETIARLELTRAASDALSFNASLEGADNFLQRRNTLLENGQAVALPGSRVRVDERRVEGAAGLAWQPAQDWSLEAGLRLERSTLVQGGEESLRRSFRYPKPRASVRWSPGESDRWRLSLSREVGQLDFSDFAASASLGGGTVSAGNAQLRPDSSWRAALSWEHHFSEDAAMTLGWTHDRISDVLDRVLVEQEGDVFDAPGNIGDGRRDTLSLDLSTPLPGMAGAHLRAALLWRRSRVTDPVTGQARGISEEKPFEGEIEFNQELASLRLNWGLLLEHLGERESKYRHDRVTRESEDAGWTLFAERRIGAHWRLRAEVTDLFGRQFREQRWNWEDSRADAGPADTELRRRTAPGTVSLTIRRSVGG